MKLTQYHREMFISALLSLVVVALVLIPIWGPFVLVTLMKFGYPTGGGLVDVVFIVILGLLPVLSLNIDGLPKLLITIAYLIFGGIAAVISSWVSLVHYGYH